MSIVHGRDLETPGEGFQFIDRPEFATDEYFLHGHWRAFVKENWERHFICGEVGCFYCRCRRKLPVERSVWRWLKERFL